MREHKAVVAIVAPEVPHYSHLVVLLQLTNAAQFLLCFLSSQQQIISIVNCCCGIHSDDVPTYTCDTRVVEIGPYQLVLLGSCKELESG